MKTAVRALLAGLILGPGSCCGLAGATAARDAAPGTPPDARQLREVTVSARFIRAGGRSALKMSVPVRDVPFSLVDYSRSFMQAVDTTNLTDLYGYMSDVQRAGPSGYDITLRGFTSSSSDPNSVLVDGLPGLPARTASPETANLARVEVVKGPSSVLYGYSQPGGFIDLITKKPRARRRTSVELRADTYAGAGIAVGRRNGYTAILDTTGALDSRERFLGRAIVQYTDAQSFRAFVLDKDLMLAPSLTWRLSGKTRATVLLEYRHGNDSWDEGLVAPNLDSRLIAPITTRYQNPEDKEMEKGESATLLLRHRFSRRLSLDLNLRTVHTEDYEIGFENGAVLKSLVTLARSDRDQDNNRHDTFADGSVTDLVRTGPIRHRLLAGITVGETIQDYNRIRLFKTPLLDIDIYDPVSGYGDAPPPPDSEPPQSHTWASARSYAAYSSDLLTFSRHWKAVVGARYESVDQEQKELRLASRPIQTKSFSDALPMGGLIYQPTAAVSFYASYSTSYVPPQPDAHPLNPAVALQAQTAGQKEVGVKLESPGARGSATLALFDIEERHVLQPVGITGLYDQIGAARGRGAEVEADLRPTRWWQLSANYAFLDARITGDVVASRIGSMTQNAPRDSASLLSRMQLPGRLASFGWLLGVIHRSARIGQLPTAAEPAAFLMPGYTTVDIGVYYAGATYDVSIKVSNLLDERYYQSAFSALRITPGDPRNVALTLRRTIDGGDPAGN